MMREKVVTNRRYSSSGVTWHKGMLVDKIHPHTMSIFLDKSPNHLSGDLDLSWPATPLVLDEDNEVPAPVVPLPSPPPVATPMVASPARRRSARLAGIEPSEYVSIIQKATQRMRVLKEGKISAGGKALLPVQLIDLAPEVSSPLPRQDVLELAAACDVPASALLDDTACV
ncbi:uncharacterized protein [Aegilops tauschii subsp. strangulata]|uniref:uncharacterized protein isoform X1 n=1 Tax=Aegilops tauschii subsp. strangulata TaxID=200361 RepID=UPI000989D7AD|nr:uncharacterized protein LOC109774862 isoform X1 [Aegilops tauschii subsp. strangulata]XP_045090709.1 uncharacterized protein LOC109774862 isoform X1 [Aegilops tauschii subsp. strangulata]